MTTDKRLVNLDVNDSGAVAEPKGADMTTEDAQMVPAPLGPVGRMVGPVSEARP